MTQFLVFLPATTARPLVRFLRIDGAGCIEVAIRLLGCCYNVEDAVDIGLQLLIWIGLQHVAGSFYGLIDICIIKGESHELAHIPFIRLKSCMTRMLQRIGCHFEILVAPFALALAESQRDGHLTGSLDALAPERLWRYFHGCKGHLCVGIAVACGLGAEAEGERESHACGKKSFHDV